MNSFECNLTATLFTLTEAGRLAGLGLVCPEARYASVRWVHADRLDRCRVSAAQWREIARVLGAGTTPGRIEPSSALGTVLAGDRLGVTVQWLTSLPAADVAPEAVAGELDGLLKRQPLTGPLTLLRESDGQPN